MAKLNRRLKQAGIAAVAFLVLLGIIILYFESALHSIESLPPPNVPVYGALGLYAQPIKGSGFYYNYSHNYVAYAYLTYYANNAMYANFTFNMYATNPVTKTYMLNVGDYCYKCYNETLIYDNLSAYMGNLGLLHNSSSLSSINFSQLGTVTNGSVVIVPSGLLPIVLLQNSSSGSIPLLTLLDHGDTIIYIGNNFSSSVGPGGVVYSNYTNTLQTLRLHGINTIPEYYVAPEKLGLYFNTPLFNFTNGTSYGKINYVHAENGSIVALSNYEQNAWNNTNQVGSDLAMVLFSRPWIPSYASYMENSTINRTSLHTTLSMVTFNTSLNTSKQGLAQIVNSSYPLVNILVHNSTSTKGQSIVFPIRFADNGTLGIPKSISDGQNFSIQAVINTNRKREVEPVITFYNLDYNQIFTFSLGHFNISQSLNSVTKNIEQPLPPGYYIITLTNLNGTYISGSVIGIKNITINATFANFQSGNFWFRVTSNNVSLADIPYSVDLNGGYRENGTTDGQGYINYTLPTGTIVPYGNETFRIHIFGNTYMYYESYNKIISQINPLYIEFAIVIIIVVIINVLAKTPDRDEFYIDVQEFRNIDKVKLSVDKSAILDIFDKVNYYYRWKYMPLTVDEIRSGISDNIKDNNMPIAITSHNTLKILNTLTVSGDVFEVDGYFVPKRWVDESGHNATYLTIFRKLRDYCIAHGILFTDLDKSEVADMVVTRSGIQAYIEIYSGKESLRALKMSRTYKTFIVFLNENERIDFLERVYNSYGEKAELMKMSVYYEYAKLIDTENLSALIF